MKEVFFDIDQFDGCVYDCPLHPGVWSDWCLSCNCPSYLSKTDETVCCNIDMIKIQLDEIAQKTQKEGTE
jgi:hypothetical protein